MSPAEERAEEILKLAAELWALKHVPSFVNPYLEPDAKKYIVVETRVIEHLDDTEGWMRVDVSVEHSDGPHKQYVAHGEGPTEQWAVNRLVEDLVLQKKEGPLGQCDHCKAHLAAVVMPSNEWVAKICLNCDELDWFEAARSHKAVPGWAVIVEAQLLKRIKQAKPEQESK